MTVPTSPKRPRYAFCSKQSAAGSEANEAAIKGYNEEHGITISIRQVKYLKNRVDQKHRAVKQVPRPMWEGKSFETAPSILTGIELMLMIKERQMGVEEGAEGRTATEHFYALAT